MKLWPFSTRSERRSLQLTPEAQATINGAGFGFDTGAGNLGRSVSTDRAMGTSAVYSCVTLLMKLIGGMPLETWRKGPDDSVLPVGNTPLANLLRHEPMPGVTGTTFWATVVAHLLLRGNAFLMKVKVLDAAGRSRVSELRIIHPDRVRIKIDDDGRKVFLVQGSGGKWQQFTRDDLIHIVGMSLGSGLVGHSVIAVMRHRLSAHVAASDHQDNMLSNGLTAKAKLKIPGIYEDPEDDTKRNLIRDSLRKFYGGSQNAGNNVVFLDRDWDLDALSITPHDAQFLEQFRFTFTEVAGWFSVPPGAIGAESGGKGLFYTSAAMNDLDLLKKGVKYWLKAIQSALLIDPDLFGVMSGRFARFNVDSLLEVDILTRFQSYEIGTRVGMYSPNRLLQIEGRPLRDDPGGDMFVTPAHAGSGSAAPTNTTTPKEGTDDAPPAG